MEIRNSENGYRKGKKFVVLHELRQRIFEVDGQMPGMWRVEHDSREDSRNRKAQKEFSDIDGA